MIDKRWAFKERIILRVNHSCLSWAKVVPQFKMVRKFVNFRGVCLFVLVRDRSLGRCHLDLNLLSFRHSWDIRIDMVNNSGYICQDLSKQGSVGGRDFIIKSKQLALETIGVDQFYIHCECSENCTY